jgi:hypothetical protein
MYLGIYTSPFGASGTYRGVPENGRQEFFWKLNIYGSSNLSNERTVGTHYCILEAKIKRGFRVKEE